MVHWVAGPDLEGGDVVAYNGGAFLGTGFRSSRDSRHGLERFIGGEVLPLELVDPRLYHLDMALSALRDGTLLVCREAFSAASFQEVRRAATGEVIAVSLQETLAFGLNCIEVEDTILCTGDAPGLATALRKRNRKIAFVALDEFHRAGGGAACLVAEVHSAQRFRTANAVAA